MSGGTKEMKSRQWCSNRKLQIVSLGCCHMSGPAVGQYLSALVHQQPRHACMRWPPGFGRVDQTVTLCSTRHPCHDTASTLSCVRFGASQDITRVVSSVPRLFAPAGNLRHNRQAQAHTRWVQLPVPVAVLPAAV